MTDLFENRYVAVLEGTLNPQDDTELENVSTNAVGALDVSFALLKAIGFRITDSGLASDVDDPQFGDIFVDKSQSPRAVLYWDGNGWDTVPDKRLKDYLILGEVNNEIAALKIGSTEAIESLVTRLSAEGVDLSGLSSQIGLTDLKTTFEAFYGAPSEALNEIAELVARIQAGDDADTAFATQLAGKQDALTDTDDVPGLTDALANVDQFSTGPFGRAGVKVILGDKLDAHYGFGGWVDLPSGKMLFVYRKASTHAVVNSGAVWVAESLDKGQTLVNHRKIGGGDATSDWRVQKPRVLANGRVGFLVNRIAEDGTDYDPILFYTDNPDAATPTWSQLNLTRPGGSTAYSFDAHAGILDFPASQGGHDTLGFIAFGFISAAGFGYLSTTDNFTNFTWTTTAVAQHDEAEAGLSDGPLTGLSETATIHIGSGRYLSYGRNKTAAGFRDEAACWAFNSLTDWGNVRPSGVQLGGNPPAAFYDASTNLVHVLAPSRQGRYIISRDYENYLIIYTADADALWAANGDFSAIAGGAVTGVPFMPMPDWATFYADPKPWKNGWAMTFTAGEDGNDGADSTEAIIAFMGDFSPSSVDQSTWAQAFRRGLIARRALIQANTNDTDNRPLRVGNQAGSAFLGIGAYSAHMDVDYDVTGDGDLTLDFDGDINLDAAGDMNLTAGGLIVTQDNILVGVTSGSELDDARIELSVPGSSIGAISSVVFSGTSRKHQRFHNTNGEVGSISTSGTATSYTTSSDPRLKTAFQPVHMGEVWSALNGLYGAMGRFGFLSDPTKPVLGFDAHKVLDIPGFGSEIGVEGVGPRDAEIGDPCKDDEGEDANVQPAGVDQSKAVPYLLAAIVDLRRELDALKAG